MVSRMVWGIRWTFIREPRSLKIIHRWALLPKAYTVWVRKCQRNYVSWHWKVMESLKKNRLLVPKMTWGIWWMLMRAVARLEICTFMWYFYQWHINFQPKKYRRIISHDTEKRSKFWRKTDFLFEKWHEELWWTLTWAVESLKICTFVECM